MSAYRLAVGFAVVMFAGVALCTYYAVAPLTTRSWRAGGWGMLLLLPGFIGFCVAAVVAMRQGVEW